MKKSLILLALALHPFALWAASVNEGSSWLKVPGSAEAAGMGGAFSAVGQDVNALSSNPAGLALLDGPQLALMHDLWVQDLTTEHLAYGQAFPDLKGGGALGLDYVNFGSVDKYNVVAGVPVAAGSYSPSAFALTAGFASELTPGLFAGVDLQALSQNLSANSSFTVAGDLGFLYRLTKDGINFSMVLSHLGGNLDQASLPLQLRLGTSYSKAFGEPGTALEKTIPHRITATLEGNLDLSGMDLSSFTLGGEYWYKGLLAARLGYHFAAYGDLTGLAGLTLGAGIRYKDFELDYALTTLGDLGATHQLSLLTRL